MRVCHSVRSALHISHIHASPPLLAFYKQACNALDFMPLTNVCFCTPCPGWTRQQSQQIRRKKPLMPAFTKQRNHGAEHRQRNNTLVQKLSTRRRKADERRRRDDAIVGRQAAADAEMAALAKRLEEATAAAAADASAALAERKGMEQELYCVLWSRVNCCTPGLVAMRASACCEFRY